MKNYNPFRMWGSYVVFIIIAVIIVLTFINTKTACPDHTFINAFYDQFNVGGPNCSGTIFTISQWLSLPMFVPALLLGVLLGEKLIFVSAIISFLIYSVFGFLIGWGIHSFFRKLI